MVFATPATEESRQTGLSVVSVVVDTHRQMVCVSVCVYGSSLVSVMNLHDEEKRSGDSWPSDGRTLTLDWCQQTSITLAVVAKDSHHDSVTPFVSCMPPSFRSWHWLSRRVSCVPISPKSS